MTNVAAYTLAAALVLASAVLGGRYTAVPIARGGDREGVVALVDRFTGSVRFCAITKCVEPSN